MKKLLLLDGHSILSRAFYGLPMLTNARGAHTNAVYGFLNIMFRVLDSEKAAYVAAAFDVDRRTLKRTQLYPEYKGTRKPMPAELHEQIPVMQSLLKAMGIPVITLEGYEADDILGTLAKRFSGEMEVTILSGDRDLLQIADEHIRITVPKTVKGKTEVFVYGPEEVRQEYQVTPSEFIDLKALMGDASDNIPGVPSIGEKTAMPIIREYHSIENAYAHADELKPPRASKALKENYELAQLSKRLATIDIHVPLAPSLTGTDTSCIYTPAALEMIRELEFKSLVTRFSERLRLKGGTGNAGGAGTGTGGTENTEAKGKTAGLAAEAAGNTGSPAATEKAGESGHSVSGGLSAFKMTVVTDPGEAGNLLKTAQLQPFCGICYTEELMPALSLTFSGEETFILPAGRTCSKEKLQEDTAFLMEGILKSNGRAAVIGLKDQLPVFKIHRNKRVFDLAIAAYLADPLKNSYKYDDISRAFLGENIKTKDELVGKHTLPAYLTEDEDGQMTLEGLLQTSESRGREAAQTDFLSDTQVLTWLSYLSRVPFLALKPALERLESLGMRKLYEEIEMPLVYSLYSMEQTGIRVDAGALSAYALRLGEEIGSREREIYELAGEKFNINSPAQLGRILFEKLGIPGGRRTKTGYSTAADVLMKINEEHPVVDLVLRYRTLTKLYSTYAVGLASFIGPDGRIHGSFNQTVTATGRISSTEPNLQNIPVRTAEGREIRRVFIPAEGSVFVDADYSQVELRILAALSGDERLIAAYENSEDIHTMTASQVFHVPAGEVTKEMRKNAKAVNFGIVYGISAFGLGEGLSISRKQAAEYIEKYFETYPGVKQYLDREVETARRDGFVRTEFGRIRPVPDIRSSNFQQRSFSERVAMNSPIQGTAADIMKVAMNKVDMDLAGVDADGNRVGKKYNARIVLQVHDELLIEADPAELQEVVELVRRDMETAARLKVGLSVEVLSGPDWNACH